MKIRKIRNPFPNIKNTSPKSGKELTRLAQRVADSLKEQAEYIRKEHENACDYHSYYVQ